MYSILRKLFLKVISLGIITILPIMLYVYIQDDVQFTWNVNDINDLNIYTMKVNVDVENKEIQLEEKIEYINKAKNGSDKLYLYILSQEYIADSICLEFEEETKGDTLLNVEPYFLDVKSISSYGKDLSYKIIGKNKNIVMVNLGKSINEGEKVEIEIKGVLDFPYPIASTKDDRNVYNVACWYPVIAEYDNGWMLNVDNSYIEKAYSKNAYYDVEISTSDKVEIITEGQFIDIQKKRGKMYMKYQGNKFSEFIFSVE